MKESDIMFMLRFEEDDGFSHRLESSIDSNNVIIGHTNHYSHYNNIKIPKVTFKYFMQHMNNISSLLEEERLEMCMRGCQVPSPALMEIAKNELEEKQRLSDERFESNQEFDRNVNL